MFITYKITNKINNKIYFGYTSMTLHQRFMKHCHEKRSTIIANSIKKYGRENFLIEHVATFNTVEGARQHETFLITSNKTNARKYPREHGMNMTNGGEGCSGYKFPLALKKKFKKEKRGWYAGSHNKPVYQFDKQGTFIKKHPSAKEAAKDVGSYGGNISNCCHGIVSSAAGFCFSYTENLNAKPLKQRRSPRRQKTYVYDENKQLLHEFNTRSEAEKFLNTDRSNLLRVIRNKHLFKNKFFVTSLPINNES